MVCNCAVYESPQGAGWETVQKGGGNGNPEPPEITPPDDGTQVLETPGAAPTELAVLQINELRTEFSNVHSNGEYIEFKVMKAGNLEGLYLYIMVDPVNPFVYEFPPVDVAAGEYITLHLQTFDSISADELGDNISDWNGNDSCPTARDLWVAGTREWLHATEIVFLQDDYYVISDAVVLNEAPGASWDTDKAYFGGITEDLFNCGMWKSADGNKPTPLDAVDTSAIQYSPLKSVCRREGSANTHSAKDWYVTADGNITPGQANK